MAAAEVSSMEDSPAPEDGGSEESIESLPAPSERVSDVSPEASEASLPSPASPSDSDSLGGELSAGDEVVGVLGTEALLVAGVSGVPGAPLLAQPSASSAADNQSTRGADL